MNQRSPVYLFAEDAVCARLGLAIVRHIDPSIHLTLRITSGFGRIRSDIPKYRKLARTALVIVITDLDNRNCPVAMLEEWGVLPLPSSRLCFRIAIRECESWLLADADGAADHFGLAASAVPAEPDQLSDPKQALLALIRKKSKGRRKIVADMLPAPRAESPVGLGYNFRLGQFVDDCWSASRAIERSPSLARAVRAVARMLSPDASG